MTVSCSLRLISQGSFRQLSRHPHRDGTEEVDLADFDTAVTENVVGGCDVKIKVWQREMVEIVGALHVPRFRAERHNDLAVGGLVDLLGVERLHKEDRPGNARLEL